jgi:hypothetical protein
LSVDEVELTHTPCHDDDTNEQQPESTDTLAFDEEEGHKVGGETDGCVGAMNIERSVKVGHRVRALHTSCNDTADCQELQIWSAVTVCNVQCFRNVLRGSFCFARVKKSVMSVKVGENVSAKQGVVLKPSTHT